MIRFVPDSSIRCSTIPTLNAANMTQLSDIKITGIQDNSTKMIPTAVWQGPFHIPVVARPYDAPDPEGLLRLASVLRTCAGVRLLNVCAPLGEDSAATACHQHNPFPGYLQFHAAAKGTSTTKIAAHYTNCIVTALSQLPRQAKDLKRDKWINVKI